MHHLCWHPVFHVGPLYLFAMPTKVDFNFALSEYKEIFYQIKCFESMLKGFGDLAVWLYGAVKTRSYFTLSSSNFSSLTCWRLVSFRI